MNRANLTILGIVVAVLVAALLLIESNDSGDLPGAGAPLLPDFRAVANDVDRIRITRAGQEPFVIERVDGRWTVPARDGYPADIGKIRSVLLAMTDAKVVEAKTANPELHDRLGVDFPDNELSKGVAISASAGEKSFEIIFGNVAQRSFRYARIADEDQSWLIDQNPDVPAEPGDWLAANVIDVDADQVRSVQIRHPDGETIAIGKESRDDSGFTVADVPDGRELSYSTVANGIGGALNDLDLDDVRPATDTVDPVRTTFETFDGVTIHAAVSTDDDGKWLALDVQLPAEPIADDAGDWQAVSDRVRGWHFRIADYKANLLTRRWEDILKPAESDEE